MNINEIMRRDFEEEQRLHASMTDTREEAEDGVERRTAEEDKWLIIASYAIMVAAILACAFVFARWVYIRLEAARAARTADVVESCQPM